MAQEERAEILSNQQINFHIEGDEYVKRVTIFSPGIIYPFHMTEKEFQERNIEFVMLYDRVTETETSLQVITVTAYFSKDGSNYKIYESGYLSARDYRESKDHPWQQMNFQARLDKSEYVGNSDNQKLLTVKIWNQIR